MAAVSNALTLPITRARATPNQDTARRVTLLYLATVVVLFLVMGLLGLTMRSQQAGILTLSSQQFYAVLTLHGTGMVTAALLGTMAALWFVLQPTLPLDPLPMLVTYWIAMAGVLCVAISTLWGGFAPGWTFLYPLPFYGWWPAWSTALFLLGDLLVGFAFGLFCLVVLIEAIRTYGGLSRALALPMLWRKGDGHGTPEGMPPPPVLIATISAIQGVIIAGSGTVIGLGLLGHLANAGVGLDPLWAKNITYFFGHSIANIAIYLAAGMVYAVMPRYAHREWPTTRPVVIALIMILVFVLPAYFHHLYMDFVQPLALDVAGEGITYAAVAGSLIVTIFGALLLVWRSNFRWTLGSVLIYAGFSGWLIGGIAAVLDVLIPFNFRLHNTLWVVGHFHSYYLLGIMLFLFGFLTHLLEEAAGEESSPRVRMLVPGAILVGGWGLLGIWLLGGLLSLPRRYFIQPPGGETLARFAVGSVFILIAGLLGLLAEWWRLRAVGYRRRHALRAGLAPLDETLLRRAGFHLVS
ncbi:MAG: cbb3-type cytochrome c oxidase subunit I [Chloroflexota bacterium]